MMSRQVNAGSRLVVVLSIVKNSGQQINYGTGKDVREESIADGASRSGFSGCRRATSTCRLASNAEGVKG